MRSSDALPAPDLNLKRDIEARFGDRLPPTKKARSFLDLSPDLIRRTFCLPVHLGSYSKIIPLAQLNQEGDDRILLTLETTRHPSREGYPKSIFFHIKKGRDFYADFVIDATALGNYALNHRQVPSSYRGPQNSTNDRLSQIVMKAIDDYFRCLAAELSKSLTFIFDAGQLSMMCLGFEQGFSPSNSPSNLERWGLIERADPRLFFTTDGYLFSSQDIPELSLSGSPLSKHDLGHPYRHQAVRVHFEKTIQPPSAEGRVAMTRAQVGEV